MGNVEASRFQLLTIDDPDQYDLGYFFWDDEQYVQAIIPVQSRPLVHDGNKPPRLQQSRARSIKVSNLKPLLLAIKADFPQWDYMSESLRGLFIANRIDPKFRYERFYSEEPADIVVTYTWKGKSLPDLAGVAFAYYRFPSVLTLNNSVHQPDVFCILRRILSGSMFFSHSNLISRRPLPPLKKSSD